MDLGRDRLRLWRNGEAGNAYKGRKGRCQAREVPELSLQEIGRRISPNYGLLRSPLMTGPEGRQLGITCRSVSAGEVGLAAPAAPAAP